MKRERESRKMKRKERQKTKRKKKRNGARMQSNLPPLYQEQRTRSRTFSLKCHGSPLHSGALRGKESRFCIFRWDLQHFLPLHSLCFPLVVLPPPKRKVVTHPGREGFLSHRIGEKRGKNWSKVLINFQLDTLAYIIHWLTSFIGACHWETDGGLGFMLKEDNHFAEIESFN